MQRPCCFHLFAAAMALTALVGANAASAELEGAIQYPPAAAGEDAQPPPPARILLRPLSPRRGELGVSGSSAPSSAQPRYLLSPPHLDKPRGPPPSEAGG